MIARDFVQSASSTSFRLVSYIFLRIIPLPICKIILPFLYCTYAALFLVAPGQRKLPRDSNVARGDLRQKSLRNSCQNKIFTSFKTACTVLLTLPTPSDRLRILSFAINSVLLLFTVDLITHPLRYPGHDTVFARVGAVDHKSAKITIRYPQNRTSEASIKIVFRAASNADTFDEENWMDGPEIQLSPDNDWINTGLVSNLWPDTNYEFKLALIDASLNFLPYPNYPLPFKTFPDPRLLTGVHFKFIATSCLLPNFPYTPGYGDRIKGFDLLSDYLAEEQEKPPTSYQTSVDGTIVSSSSMPKAATSLQPTSGNASSLNDTQGSKSSRRTLLPEFLLFLGDFIYADVPVFFGDSEEAYRRLYRRNYASPSFRKIYEKLPILHIYDDHEIINNYAGQSNDSIFPFRNASDAFMLYNAQSNYDSVDKGQYYYDFRYGDVAFFVMDTRRHRSSIADVDINSRSMLGEPQLLALEKWLSEVNQTTSFKFIVSSVPFTSLWQHDGQLDSWAAFSQERSRLLKIFQTVPNVFIISGDRHEFALIEFNGLHEWSQTVMEISTSPLNMFYVPLLRSLKMESSQYVQRRPRRDADSTTDDTESVTMEPYLVSEERVLKYLPVGNHKWSTFEIDTHDPARPTLSLEVMIDGQSAYRRVIYGVPVVLKKPATSGVLVPQSIQGILDKIGLTSRKWY